MKFLWLPAACLLSLGHQVSAQAPTGTTSQADVVAADPVTVDGSASPAPFADETVLADDQLVAQNGREDLAQVARNDQVASSANNSVGGNSRTGTVTFSDQSFQNVSGLTIVNANSGNNVAMNAAMNVNISINPGP